jgi:hypothetical protein
MISAMRTDRDSRSARVLTAAPYDHQGVRNVRVDDQDCDATNSDCRRALGSSDRRKRPADNDAVLNSAPPIVMLKRPMTPRKSACSQLRSARRKMDGDV